MQGALCCGAVFFVTFFRESSAGSRCHHGRHGIEDSFVGDEVQSSVVVKRRASAVSWYVMKHFKDRESSAGSILDKLG